MEEHVGALWHRLVTRLADTGYPEARVGLDCVAGTLGVFFRALGGDGGLEVTSAEGSVLGNRRSWLQRIAGSHGRVALAWRDERSLRLPAVMDWLPSAQLNRDLYLWLAALAAGDGGQSGTWFVCNQSLTRSALERFPGLVPKYRRLVQAHLDSRPNPEHLPPAEGAQEQAIRSALLAPGAVDILPSARRAPHPVPLWLHPSPPALQTAEGSLPENATADAERRRDQRRVERLRRRGVRTAAPEPERGLVTVRMENIFTWGEYVKVDRGSEDEEDLDRAEQIARDLDELAVSRANRAAAATLKFDLDLPAEAEDDLVLEEGMLLPEWDWSRRRLQPDHCRVVPLIALDAPPCELPQRLRNTAKRLRNQFQALAPARIRHRAQADGQEIDVDAYLRFAADRAAGRAEAAEGLYLDSRAGARDLACLLMADLSLSTDTWVNDHQRVIDVIRNSLFLFAESLTATGDEFGIYGFSSRKRDPIRVHRLKGFDEAYDSHVRGRIQAIKPGYYTRLGAAIRYGARLLSASSAGRRLLLLLTDGKPNDLDKYEGRYGIEDTREAVREARRLGLQPFCVTIDEHANEYLPHLFGNKGYVVIRRPEELPRRLPLLYAQFTA